MDANSTPSCLSSKSWTRGDDPEEVIRRITDYRGDEKHSSYARHTVEKAQAEIEHEPIESAESAIGFGRRLQRREIAGLRNMGSCSIPTAPTNLSF
jgi:hypothetical protein